MRWILVLAALGLAPAVAHARPARRPVEVAPPGVELSLAPVEGTAFAYRFGVRVVGSEDELVADSRLLAFRIEIPSGRRVRVVRCTHPAAPRRVDPERVLRRSEGTLAYDETVDLRMYCFGSKLDAALTGARIVPEYGFARGSATAYVARRTEGVDPAPRRRPAVLARIEGASFSRAPVEPSTASNLPPIFAGVRPVDVASSGRVVFRPFIESRRDGVRLYLRDDHWLLRVRRPDGEERVCGMSRQPVVPIVDFFAKLRRGRRVTSTLDATRFCPDGTFDAPGIYEVVPDVTLPYDGARFGFEAITGDYRGRVGYVRVRPRPGTYVIFPTTEVPR